MSLVVFDLDGTLGDSRQDMLEDLSPLARLAVLTNKPLGPARSSSKRSAGRPPSPHGSLR